MWCSAVLAPVALIVGFLLAQSRQRPGFDPLRDTLSSLAAHPAVQPWVMTTGFVLLGASHMITAAGLPAAGPLARVLLAVGGIATLVVAASPQPAALHVPAAKVSFVALGLWAALTPGGLRRVGLSLTALDAALLIWFVVELRSGDYVGLSERAVAVSEALTPIAILVALRRSSRAPTAGGPSTDRD